MSCDLLPIMFQVRWPLHRVASSYDYSANVMVQDGAFVVSLMNGTGNLTADHIKSLVRALDKYRNVSAAGPIDYLQWERRGEGRRRRRFRVHLDDLLASNDDTIAYAAAAE